MGCDIHLYVERRENDRWLSADVWVDEDGRKDVPFGRRYYSGRNYGLFSILANVRNGIGFAGVDTGDGYRPIAEPRDLPPDVSAEIAGASAGWAGDGHSHSWLTVAELMAYDWTQVTKRRGWVTGPEYADWNRYARSRGMGPQRFSGMVAGRDVRHVDETEMRRLIDAAIGDKYGPEATLALKPLALTYTQAEWEEPYYRAGGDFLAHTLPQLWRLGKPEDVRIVFWFDN